MSHNPKDEDVNALFAAAQADGLLSPGSHQALTQVALLAHTRYLNGHVLFPYRPIDQAVRMTQQNYRADKGTPLYDQAVVLLGSVLAKTQAFAQSGVACRSVTLLITDGRRARGSSGHRPDSPAEPNAAAPSVRGSTPRRSRATLSG